jgi:hypothetical protein
LDARLTTLLCKKIIVAKSKEVKTGCNTADSCKEGLFASEDDDNDDDLIYLFIVVYFTTLSASRLVKWRKW